MGVNTDHKSLARRHETKKGETQARLQLFPPKGEFSSNSEETNSHEL